MISEQKVTDLLLYLENDAGKQFSKWLTGVNIFEVLGIASAEIRHSRMLAWLLNPRENHQLSDKFLKKLLLKILEKNSEIREIRATTAILKDFSSAFVFRESKKNIDIFFNCPSQKFNLIIENKTFTQDHDNQLRKYRKFIDNEYRDYQNLYLYLTPSGNMPINAGEAESKHWKLLSYQEISDILNEILMDETIDSKVKYIIQEYNDNIRRNILNDQELKELSTEIYFKYKEILDLIIENRPNAMDLRNDLLGLLNDLERERRIIFNEKDCSKGILRFRTHQLDDFLATNLDSNQSDWNGGSTYFYEITFQNFQLDCYLSLYNKPRRKQSNDTISKTNIMASDWYATNGFNTRNRFESLDISEENILNSSFKKKIKRFLNNNLERISEFEREIIKKWNEENQ